MQPTVVPPTVCSDSVAHTSVRWPNGPLLRLISLAMTHRQRGDSPNPMDPTRNLFEFHTAHFVRYTAQFTVNCTE